MKIYVKIFKATFRNAPPSVKSLDLNLVYNINLCFE